MIGRNFRTDKDYSSWGQSLPDFALTRTFKAEVQREFPREWEFEIPSACSFIARSGPLTIDLDETLPEPICVSIELNGIPVDFRAHSVAEARLKLVEFASGLTELLGKTP